MWLLFAACLSLVTLPPRAAVAAGDRLSPPAIGVIPFQSRRGGENQAWMARFLTEGLRESLLFSAGGPVLGARAAELWRYRLGLDPLKGATREQLSEMGLSHLLQGKVHLVLNLVQIEIRLTGAGGDLFPEGLKTLRLDMVNHTPEAMLDRLLVVVSEALPKGVELHGAPQPSSWSSLQAFYALPAGAAAGGDEAERLRLAERLDDLGDNPGLEGRAHGLRARLLLEEAQLTMGPGGKRQDKLRQALSHVRRSLAAEPWHSGRLALKGELHYLLKEHYEAGIEASIARLKNPLDGLAHAVLGLIAGLSTGEATDMMRQALKVDPSLRTGEGGSQPAPFQNGVLEPFFKKWETLRSKSEHFGARDTRKKMKTGIDHFLNSRWEEAELDFHEAIKLNEYDYAPHLYLARIQIMTGEVDEAVEVLNKLSAEFPQEAEIYFYHGIALETAEIYPEAEEAFKKSLIENPDDPETLFHIGTTAMGQQHWERARDTFNTLLNKVPNHERGWLGYGIVHAKLELWMIAGEAFTHVLQLNPDSKEAAAWRRSIQPKLEQPQ